MTGDSSERGVSIFIEMFAIFNFFKILHIPMSSLSLLSCFKIFSVSILRAISPHID